MIAHSRSCSSEKQKGSAMIMAVFVLVLLTGLGTCLLFLTSTEMQMSQADLRGKQAFYIAEAGLEDGRISLWDVNRSDEFTDDLENAAGGDKVVDFDVSKLLAQYDKEGHVVGFTGYGDDRPLRPFTAFADGAYAAFLTNDPIDGATNTTDSNERVMITAIGAGADRSVEVIHAIVDFSHFLPGAPPATLTLLGPAPEYRAGTARAKTYEGEDCAGAGIPGMYMPVVGAIGSSAESDIENGMQTNPTYQSGPLVDEDVFSDLLDSEDPAIKQSPIDGIEPGWLVCQNHHDYMDTLYSIADVICPNGSFVTSNPDIDSADATKCVIPAARPDRIIFCDGDCEIAPRKEGGMLAVTGRLVLSGNTSWVGMIMAVGRGEVVVKGSGTGKIVGGVIVADIAGPDNVYDTGDDCSGDDGGFSRASFVESGGGNSGTIYCSEAIAASFPVPPYKIREFLQR